MALIPKTRGAQDIQCAEFTWTFGDTVLDTTGAADALTTVAAHVADIISLPVNAIVLGGEVITDTTFTGSTAVNVKIGDSGSDNRYLGTTDKITAGRTALVPTGYVNTGGLDLRLTLTPTVAAVTAGKITVRVEFMIRGRVCHNLV